MKAFATYLQEKNYSNSTISTYCKYIDLLTVWALEQNMVLHELRYKNILSFVRECISSQINSAMADNIRLAKDNTLY